MLRWLGSSWIDISWAGFAVLNLVAMQTLPDWRLVPFLAIWVSLTLIYGLRLWRLQPTLLTIAAVTLATGGIIGVQVIQGAEDADYLLEVPLIALMFLLMVGQGRRRLAAMQVQLTAAEQVHRISQDNLRLLNQQQRFLQDAAHELGTPITIALGHAELIERAATDSQIAADAHVVTEELTRLRGLTTRLLLLAAAGSPNFVHMSQVSVDTIVLEALDRWSYAPRQWQLGTLADPVVPGDHDRLAAALDALLETAVAHTVDGDRIELSARLDGQYVVLAVADAGHGIPAAQLEQIYDRFSRVEPPPGRGPDGGFGLGLAVAHAIAEAHSGSIRVHSTVGEGSRFALLLPLAAPAAASRPASHPEPS